MHEAAQIARAEIRLARTAAALDSTRDLGRMLDWLGARSTPQVDRCLVGKKAGLVGLAPIAL